jgi:uncharacterized protein YndB with AHSA1/START domain
MATVAISPDHDTIHGEVFIAAPPARVFQALTDPSQMPLWWGQKEMYRVTKFESDVRPGGKWKSVGVNAKGETFEVGGEYLEVDPPHLLVQTWIASWSGTLATKVRWELQTQEDGTVVRITHSGFAGNVSAANDHTQGWQRVLSWLSSYAEKGQTIETRPDKF